MFVLFTPTLFYPSITILHALTCARVDYGNAVYLGLSSIKASKLQAILNATARHLGGIAKFARISFFTRNSLHWRNVRQCLQFKEKLSHWL